MPRAVVTTTLPPTTTTTTMARTPMTLRPTPSSIRLPSGLVVTRPSLPILGERPAAGTPAPVIPSGTPELSLSTYSRGGVVRLSADVVRDTLLHIYKAGVLIKSLTAQELSDFSVPGSAEDARSIHVVAVSPSGEVSATAEPEVVVTTTTTTVPPTTTTTTTTVPPTTTTTTTTVPPTTTVRVTANIVKSGAAKSGAAKSGAAKSGAAKSGAASKAAAPSSGKSSTGRSGQRSTSDTTKTGK